MVQVHVLQLFDDDVVQYNRAQINEQYYLPDHLKSELQRGEL